MFIDSPSSGGCSKPQSNQRGIETSTTLEGHNIVTQCLNRTSVGLKLFTPGVLPAAPGAPQSNQRGIETPPILWMASIA